MLKLNSLVSAGAVVALTMGAVGTAEAQLRSDKAIYFTFSQPVTLPQTTLPAGKYLFRLADSLTNRQVVQIFKADGADSGKLAAMMMTIPAIRNDVPNDPEIRFLETPADMAPAIDTYWYPGEKTGWEFIYPRSQAAALARSAKRPILASATDASGDAMTSAELVRVSPSGEQMPYDDNGEAPAMSASARTERGEVAAADDNAFASPAPAREPARAQDSSVAMTDQERTSLPATASRMPTVVFIGIAALGAALWLGRRAAV